MDIVITIRRRPPLLLHPSRRQNDILRAIRVRGSCAIAELAEELAVSEETIRRDVRPLANEGLVLRIHGRVASPERFRETPFDRRLQESTLDKQRIATRTAELIPHGSSLMMDTGTTTSFVARALTQHRNLVIITNSIDIAHTLSTRNGNRIYMAGGVLREDDGASLSPIAVRFVEQFTADYAILSIKAIDPTHGLMDAHLAEAEFSRAVIERAARTIVVADHTKFERKGLVSVCRLAEIDTLVTSLTPPDPYGELLSAANVDVEVA